MNKVSLSSITKGGKGKYGIAASAVELNECLPMYLRITDISDDGTLSTNGRVSVADDNANQYMLEPDDIVFARTGASVGRNYLYDPRDGEFAFAGFLIKFAVDNARINPRWVKYFCQSQQYSDWVQSFNAGSTRGNINAKTYEAMPIPAPNRDYQDKAVTLLDSIEEKRRINSRLNDYLLQLAETIFKAWFISDDALLPTRKVAMDEIATINAGGDKPSVCQKTPREECSVPIYSNGIDNEGLYGYTSVAKITEPSVTVSARGTIGFTCLRHESYFPIVRLISATPGNRLTAEYLYLWLRNTVVTGVGTTQQQLTVPMFKRYEVDIPSVEDLNKFTEIATPLFETIDANKAESSRLAELRDTLLPKLMTGEIDVSKVAI